MTKRGPQPDPESLKPTKPSGTLAIDKVRHAASSKRRKVEVPAWGLDLWFGPVTISDIEAVENRKPKSPHERNLILLIHKARDAEGNPVFRMGDLHYLKTEADWVILQEVFAKMFESAIGAGDVKEAEKELGETPASGGD